MEYALGAGSSTHIECKAHTHTHSSPKIIGRRKSALKLKNIIFLHKILMLTATATATAASRCRRRRRWRMEHKRSSTNDGRCERERFALHSCAMQFFVRSLYKINVYLLIDICTSRSRIYLYTFLAYKSGYRVMCICDCMTL